MVKIVWTELSISDLKDIFDYIADDSIRYASITANKIYQSVHPIIENPFIGRMVPEFSKNHGNYTYPLCLIRNVAAHYETP